MRVLSLFSGIGGFDLGLEMAGMEVVAQVEIDPYCRRILEKHWPDIARYEDVRSVGVQTNGWLGYAGVEGAIALAEGGDGARHPKRAGGIDLICGGFPCQDLSVAGKRAGLDGERSGLWFEFKRIVSEVRPRYVLVENVPGLLSSNGGRDFEIVLRGLGDLRYAVSWAVLDSRHFGVAQRRRRVFIVAGPDPESTEAVLALAEGCRGHPAAGRAAGEDVAGEAGGGVAKSLRARANASHREDSDTYIPEVVGALDQAMAHHGFGGQAQGATAGHLIAHTLSADGFDASEDGTGRGTPLVAFATQQTPKGFSSETVPTLQQPSRSGGGQPHAAMVGASVRRLTPVECARLQGFPDDWLDGADGPQYRALGNAVTVPVIQWLGERIMAVERESTMSKREAD